MYKKIFFISLVIVSLVVLVSCQTSEPVTTDENMSDTESEEVVEEDNSSEEVKQEDNSVEVNAEMTLELTLEELEEYDGKDGQKAYVAVEGIIYDVTDIPEWQNGMHNGQVAGKDVTDAIKNQSPHGLSVLSKAEVVGKLK